MNTARLTHIRTKTAFERYLNRNYDGSIEAFYADLNRESDRLIRTDLKKAQRLTVQTAGLERCLPDQYRGHLYRIWGRHCHLSGEYSAARKLYARASSVFLKIGDQNSCARVQKALLDVLMYLGRYDKAVEAGRKSLAYFRRVHAHNDIAQVLTNLGNLYHRLDENKRALAYYNRAYDIFRRSDNKYALAVVQFNRGNIYCNLNELKEAEQLYREAAATYRSLGMELAACQADYSLANVAFLQGAYSEAITGFNAVAECFHRLGDDRCRGLAELDLVEVYLHLNLFSQAISDAESVAATFGDLNISYERAKALYLAAVGYFAFGDYARVVHLTRQALALFRQENNRVWQVLCRFLLAKVDCQEGRIIPALKTFREVGAFYKRQGDVRRYHDVRLAWLDALLISGNYRAADLIIQGIDKSRGGMAGYQKYIFYALRGDLCRARGRLGSAARLYRRAIAEAERLQETIFPDEVRRFFWLDKLSVYNRLAAIHIEAGQENRAFAVLEKGKAAVAIGPAEHGSRQLRQQIPEKLDRERTRLRAYLRKLLVPAAGGMRQTMAQPIRPAEHRLWKIEQALQHKGFFPSTGTARSECTPEAIQAKLGDHDILLHYLCRDEAFGIFIVGRAGFDYVPLDSSVREIRDLLARFYFMTNRAVGDAGTRPVLQGLIRQLSNSLWRPVHDRLGTCTRLFLVPDGILGRLPFYILNDGDETSVYEKYETYVFSSSSAFLGYDLKKGCLGKDASVSIIAVSDDLPGASLEGSMIARHLQQSRFFWQDRATSANLFASLERPDGLVHLIAHAAQSYENYLFSTIVLADGPVYPFDLLAHPVRSRLVVLSACQTGDPGLYYNSDSLSLAQSFLLAGAKNVIASYWPVSDEVTCRFMNRFYRALSERENFYFALRQAMAEIKSRSDDIRHWAPFYLICS